MMYLRVVLASALSLAMLSVSSGAATKLKQCPGPTKSQLPRDVIRCTGDEVAFGDPSCMLVAYNDGYEHYSLHMGTIEESKYVGGCMGNNMSNRTLTLQDARKLSTHCTALTCDAKKGKGQVDISLYCDRDLKWFHQQFCNAHNNSPFEPR